MFLQICLFISLFSVWPTCFWVGDRECVFSVYPRGGGAGFWDKLCPCGRESCAITHTNTLRTATRSAGRGPRGIGTCPLTSTHTHTFFSHCLLNPTPCQALILHKLERRTLQIVHLLLNRLGTWGPQFTDPRHTVGPMLLYQEVSSLPYPQIPASQFSTTDL